jgi:NAD(P)-dependent dehydrogenase (short-subunit alcohol dehydrogenase family)
VKGHRQPGEYARNNIRFNAVAPGAVDTSLVKAIPKDFLMTLSPMGAISEAKDIADAVIYLTEARHITDRRGAAHQLADANPAHASQLVWRVSPCVRCCHHGSPSGPRRSSQPSYSTS